MRCSRVANGYSTNVTQRYGEGPSKHLTFDTDLWQEVSGGVKKGRTFRFGYHTDPNAILAGTSSGGGASSSSRQEIVDLKTQLQELKEREERRAVEEEARRA
ncbi:hypothetical protein L6452_01314 [Arctium lappa]|uniref:Uncharacterized protein n=1 Tax=Arctium lappa TaxID=4217 RepID=A0ACB9FGC6_ARCLA|nr:hypothetical protein L6452_01314 [Arctium lappa]